MSVTLYDPSQNIIEIAGHICIGISEIAVNRGNATTKVIDGISEAYSARCLVKRKPYTVSVTLQQTSISNSFLQQIQSVTERNPVTFVSIKVYSTSGVVHLDTTGWIETSPNLTLTEDLSDRQYTFKANPYTNSGIVDLIM